MAKTKEHTKKDLQDDLASGLQDALNKQFKDTGYQAAFFIDTEKDNPANIKHWVSTGSDMLDLAVSNRPNGGLPAGRIVEVTGLEGSGKSLVCAHLIAETQKAGGLGVYIDTESAVDETFFATVGVDLAKMLYIPMEKIEDAFAAVETIITQVRKNDKDRLVTIVVDSIMGSTTNREKGNDYQKEGYNTDKAIILSMAMRKITNLIAREKILLVCTNQLRNKLGVSFGDPWTTSGGKALAFHATIRLRLKSMGQIKTKINGVDTVVGLKTQVQVVKNRVGPPFKAINYDIYFDSGIDNYGGWLNVLKAYRIVDQSGAWYTYTPNGGEEIKFQSKDFVEKIINVPELRDEVYGKLCDKYIMKYTPNKDGGIDDIQIVDAWDEGEEIADQLG